MDNNSFEEMCVPVCVSQSAQIHYEWDSRATGRCRHTKTLCQSSFFKQVTTPPREWLIPLSYPLCLIRTLTEEPRGMWQYSWFHTAARVASVCSTFHASLRINLIGGYFIIMLATGDKTLCTRVKKNPSCVNTAILGITESGCSYQTTENANDTKESQ